MSAVGVQGPMIDGECYKADRYYMSRYHRIQIPMRRIKLVTSGDFFSDLLFDKIYEENPPAIARTLRPCSWEADHRPWWLIRTVITIS